MEYNKITSRPPLPQKENLQSFLEEANKPVVYTKSKDVPWKAPHIRADVKKAFTVHLPEEYVVKLQYIKEKTNQSQQKTARDAICVAVDQIIKELI